MRILPVLDLLGGQVVRAVAGRRQDYRPLVSPLAASSRPVDVVRGFLRHFGLTELYLADLDAIAGAAPATATFAALRDEGFRLWVDAGLRDAAGIEPLTRQGIADIVMGLETVAGPAALADLVAACGPAGIFSLDLRQGRLLGDVALWQGADVWSIAARAVDLGVRRLLVLDLARVGVGSGTGTEDLCGRLTTTFPEVEVSAGGGVRGLADVVRLRDAGIRVALVASALHDGSLRREDLEGL